MPRLLNDKPCEVTFFDRISESKITLSYRLPTTEERVAFANALVTRRGNKVDTSMGEARLKFAGKILLGFKDGAFATDKGPLSCDPASPDYDPAWKTFIRQYAQDVLIMLAIHVFEASVVTSEADDEEEKGKEEDPL
ncbi:MAG: hypothetical protein NTY86_13245 [Deltaproteobacteria bacterium]|nr:hypothetical protein [Deltaproteobacteria bacterium]